MCVRTLGQFNISFFILFNFGRRAIMAAVIVYGTKYPWAQLMTVMYLNQFYMMYTIYHRIYISQKDQIISNLNEIVTLLTVYHLFCFTDFV